MGSDYFKKRMAEIDADPTLRVPITPRPSRQPRKPAPTNPKAREWQQTCDPEATCYADPLMLEDWTQDQEAAWLYVATDGKHSKVGMTRNLAKRSADHRGANNQVTFGYLVPAVFMRELEMAAHEVLTLVRIKNAGREWFRISSEEANCVVGKVVGGYRPCHTGKTIIHELREARCQVNMLRGSFPKTRKIHERVLAIWEEEFDNFFPDPDLPMIVGMRVVL